MVAGQIRSTRPPKMDRPRGGSPVAASRTGATPTRQPTLAEEIDEIERAQRVTSALQAQVEQHGITQNSPNGRTPQTRDNVGVSVTPKRNPKKGKTPSPVRIDVDGSTWTHEDDNESEEEEQEQNENESQVSSSSDPRARAGSDGAGDQTAKPKEKKKKKSV